MKVRMVSKAGSADLICVNSCEVSLIVPAVHFTQDNFRYIAKLPNRKWMSRTQEANKGREEVTEQIA